MEINLILYKTILAVNLIILLTILNSKVTDAVKWWW